MNPSARQIRVAMTTATVLLLAAMPAAHAGSCAAYGDKRLVFLLQGQGRSVDGQSEVARSVIGRLVFDNTGLTGRFSLTANGGDPAQTVQEQGSFSCASTRPLSGLVQQLTLSNGLKLLALRERGAVQLMVNGAQTSLAGEARAAAAWDALPQGACEVLAGKVYTGRGGGDADGVATASLSQWRFDLQPGLMQGWQASTQANAAVSLERPVTACTPWAPDQAALLTINNGSEGHALAYPAADGSLAWIHTYPGRGVGGWLHAR